MPQNLKKWFICYLRWIIHIIPAEYYEFVTKYFFKKQCKKSKVKFPGNSVINELYNKWKAEIEEAFAEDTKRKQNDRKQYPDYFKNVVSIF